MVCMGAVFVTCIYAFDFYQLSEYLYIFGDVNKICTTERQFQKIIRILSTANQKHTILFLK